MRWSIAFVWLATGFLVLHPAYREVGAAYLARLGLPSWVMLATCFGEVALGLEVALGSPSAWLCALQIVLILGFTVILAWLDPMLLVHPFGLLSKNLPLLALIWTAWLVEHAGWSRCALWWLRVGMAMIWITDGLLPKLLFQQPMELAFVRHSGLVAGNPATFLRFMGGCELASGVAVLFLGGRPLQWILAGQIAALVILPLLVSCQTWLLWVHPFGPLIKNVPIMVGTWIVLRKSSPGSRLPLL